MNQFYTEIEIPKYKWSAGYKDKLIFMGSCFSENIGEQLRRLKFNTDINPFGALYNPSSVLKSIKILLSEKQYKKEDLFKKDGIWGSFDHHGKFSCDTEKKTLQKINDRINFSRPYLKQANYLFITFGTSWVYHLKSTGEIVSNCHKFAENNFQRELLSPEKIIKEYKKFLPELWTANPNLKIIFTVSPIRHKRDGYIDNQISKSVLIYAIHQIIETFGKDRCNYFPSYEIMMDELRDYRFYDSDMIHPGQVAIDYILEKIKSTLISKESLILMEKISKIIKAREHRILHPGSESYIKFITQNITKINDLTAKHPYLNLSEEKDYFEKKSAPKFRKEVS